MQEDLDDDYVLDGEILLLELVRAIVSHPQDVMVEAAKGDDATILMLTVNQEDRGRVIGKERKTIEAIRHLLAKTAFQTGHKSVVQLMGQDVPKKRA